ncbi:MAG: GNAT family N-acetyltransferase [Pseudomonadota bacterium]
MADVVCVDDDAAETLSRLHFACFDEGWNAGTFARLMSPQGSFALLAYDGEGAQRPSAAIGFALVRHTRGESELLTLGVVPACRDMGVARQLMTALLDRVAKDGAMTMVLEVAEDNHAARHLYETFGFVAVGRRAGYYRRDEEVADAVTMRADLAGPKD